MARMKDGMKELDCGCIHFQIGPPIINCEKHQSLADKKEAREKSLEEKGLRKLVIDQATELGHALSRFKEYASQDGKWVAHCHGCGSQIIVYDAIPPRGDQIAGNSIFKPCVKSELIDTLGAVDREAFKFSEQHAD